MQECKKTSVLPFRQLSSIESPLHTCILHSTHTQTHTPPNKHENTLHKSKNPDSTNTQSGRSYSGNLPSCPADISVFCRPPDYNYRWSYYLRVTQVCMETPAVTLKPAPLWSSMSCSSLTGPSNPCLTSQCVITTLVHNTKKHISFTR